MRAILALAPAALLTIACSASPDPSEGSAGQAVQPGIASPSSSSPGNPPIAATPSRAPLACADGVAPQAYVWASDGTLFAFDPGTLATRSLGVISCTSSANPYSLAVSRSGVAYVGYDDGSVYEVDIASLACASTPLAPGQLGLQGFYGIALGAETGADRLYVYGESTLGVSDVSDFILFDVGQVEKAPTQGLDLKVDPYGRMFGLSSGGTLLELDPSTGSIVGQDSTGFDGSAGWALLSYESRLYFIGGRSGGVSLYDIASKSLLPTGQVNQGIVGAAAVPCIPATGAAPGSTASANPFSPGEVWIGTYGCAQGVTDVALAVDTVDGNSMTGRFDFDWVSGSTTGSFALTGSFDPVTHKATFTPGPGESQPGPSWSTVGMDGFVDLSGLVYSGDITFQGCGAFSVHR